MGDLATSAPSQEVPEEGTQEAVNPLSKKGKPIMTGLPTPSILKEIQQPQLLQYTPFALVSLKLKHFLFLRSSGDGIG